MRPRLSVRRPRPSPRRVALLLTLLSLSLPRAVGAQGIPTMDTNQWMHLGQNVVAKMAEWYAVATQWRGAMLDKAATMYDYTSMAMQLRAKYEADAIGELGTIGGYVPDWRNYASMCGVEVSGTTACNANTQLKSRFEGFMTRTYLAYSDKVFAVVAEVQDSVGHFIGREFARGAAEAEKHFANRASAHRATSGALIEERAAQSVVLTDAAEQLNILLDSLEQDELAGKPLSSGRAKQITAHLALEEAKVELDLAKTRVSSLRLGAVQAADDMRDARTGRWIGSGPALVF